MEAPSRKICSSLKPRLLPDFGHKQQQQDSSVKEAAPPGGSEAQCPHLVLTQRPQKQACTLALPSLGLFLSAFTPSQSSASGFQPSELVRLSFIQLSPYYSADRAAKKKSTKK